MSTIDQQEKMLSNRTIISLGLVFSALIFSVASFLLTFTGFYYVTVILKWGAGLTALALAFHTVNILRKKNLEPSTLTQAAYASLTLSVLCLSWLLGTSIVLAVL
ncbi:hypothetical protein DFP93_11876 [Aneurinibacillus soli]|uniref:Uncharacterized protein n=2 Tax=Aneurinibacillus soli TaxID=1500254 RepID=A0A0U5B6W2_9BACL|nr:hypothetical protein DFP93_11876 [Aneurinibacillus soli]BAU26684.1 hypothetical protein CB4_00827 [Aneurinibacillus soli]